MNDRPLTSRAKHALGNGNTLRTVALVLGLLATAIAIGILPKVSDIYTRAEAKDHAAKSERVHERLDERVTATERAVTKLETIEKLLTERLPPPRKR
jgi:hypothetical protein